MQKYLERLNNEQREAATTIDGRVLILAGAGSGKTATLVARVANMLDNNIPPEEILLLTFTNKAAQEMRERIALMVGEDKASKITATTFHSFCANFVRTNAKLVDLPYNFTILDSPDSKDVVDIARQEFLSSQKIKGVEYDLQEFPKTNLLISIFSLSINSYCGIKKAIELTDNEEFENEILEIHKLFKRFKEERALLDYDDLLLFTVKILEENEHIRAYLDKRYKYISCDEYQDTNTIQNLILDYLSKDYPNLAVVGDDNQSIYGWRCADIFNILTFDKKYPDCKSIVLFENYRSSQEILDFANAVMKNATEGIPKELHGQFSNKVPTIVFPNDSFEEKAYIVDKIQELHADGMKYKDMAIIMRASRQSSFIETELMSRGIPFQKFGGIKFLERVVVKDVLAFVRIMVNNKDELAWFRILQLYPGIGKTYAKKIASDIAKNGPDILSTIYPKRAFKEHLEAVKAMIDIHKNDSLHTYLDYIIYNYYPEVKKEYIQQKKISDTQKADELFALTGEIEEAKLLIALAEKYRSAASFLADLVLDAVVEKEEDNDYVNITTVHSAKGLEYDVVFFLDLIEGVTPSCKEGDDEDAEELRVFYVAITRAKKELYLFVPQSFQLGPRINCASCSHFLTHKNVYDSLGIDGVPNRSFNVKRSSYFDW